MKDGSEKPILVTDKVRGRYRFRAARGGEYGKRRLRAYVIHGGTLREVTVEDRYKVTRPARLRAPRIVRAWRDRYTVTARWKGVHGAHGYLAEVAVIKHGKRVSAYRRMVGPNRRRIRIPSHPGGSWAIANVQALNVDGVPGRTGRRRFRLSPPNRMSLRRAGRQSADTSTRHGSRVRVRVICPISGHCQTAVLLKLGSHTVGSTRFQQIPDTYRFVTVAPRSAKLRRKLATGKLNRLRVVVRQHRVGGRTTLGSDLVEDRA